VRLVTVGFWTPPTFEELATGEMEGEGDGVRALSSAARFFHEKTGG